MHRKKIVLILMLAIAGWLAPAAQAHEFSGARAMDYTRKTVAFGPRPPGSAALRSLRAYHLAQLKLVRGCEVIQDNFTGHTPLGAIAMVNIIARFPGKSGRAVVAHRTLRHQEDGRRAFRGGRRWRLVHRIPAGDGRNDQGMPHNDDIYLVWFDGEEAFWPMVRRPTASTAAATWPSAGRPMAR